jgi:hypothetical protein
MFFLIVLGISNRDACFQRKFHFYYSIISEQFMYRQRLVFESEVSVKAVYSRFRKLYETVGVFLLLILFFKSRGRQFNRGYHKNGCDNQDYAYSRQQIIWVSPSSIKN